MRRSSQDIVRVAGACFRCSDLRLALQNQPLQYRKSAIFFRATKGVRYESDVKLHSIPISVLLQFDAVREWQELQG